MQEPNDRSTSEVGHVKNLNNYEDFILYCSTLEPVYNPVKERIKVADMQIHHDKATGAHVNLRTTKAELTRAVNKRQEVMKDIKKTATRMHGALVSVTDDDRIVADFLTLNRKIQGKLSMPKTNDDQTNQELMRAVSSSQQSIDHLIDNFEDAVKLLELVPGYVPNETDLTISELEAYVVAMKKANNEVQVKFNLNSDALDLRDKVFYEPKFGIVDNAKEAKQYIISVYTFNSPQNRRVQAIHFRNLSRYK